jgi:hypothetical protein
LSIKQNWPGASLSGAWREAGRILGKFPGAPQGSFISIGYVAIA